MIIPGITGLTAVPGIQEYINPAFDHAPRALTSSQRKTSAIIIIFSGQGSYQYPHKSCSEVKYSNPRYLYGPVLSPKRNWRKCSDGDIYYVD